jgi:hypothetical protein
MADPVVAALRVDVDALRGDLATLRDQLGNYDARLNSTFEELKTVIGQLAGEVTRITSDPGRGRTGVTPSQASEGNSIDISSPTLVCWNELYPIHVTDATTFGQFKTNTITWLKEAGVATRYVYEVDVLLDQVKLHLLGIDPQGEQAQKSYSACRIRVAFIWVLTTSGLPAALKLKDQISGSTLPPDLRVAMALSSPDTAAKRKALHAAGLPKGARAVQHP